jgi:hypothetical protein
MRYSPLFSLYTQPFSLNLSVYHIYFKACLVDHKNLNFHGGGIETRN